MTPGLESVRVRARNVLGRSIGDLTVNIEEHGGHGGTHLVADIRAPGYKRTRSVLDFNNEADVLLLAEPDAQGWPNVELASLRLHDLILRSSYVAGRELYDYYLARDERGRLNRVASQPDRVWIECSHELPDCLATSGAWGPAPAKLHGGPEALRSLWPEEPIASYKGPETHCAAQLTLWRVDIMFRRPHTVLEVDVDINKGIRHLFDALIRHPLTGEPDPRIVAQLVTYYRGLRLPWSHEL